MNEHQAVNGSPGAVPPPKPGQPFRELPLMSRIGVVILVAVLAEVVIVTAGALAWAACAVWAQVPW